MRRNTTSPYKKPSARKHTRKSESELLLADVSSETITTIAASSEYTPKSNETEVESLETARDPDASDDLIGSVQSMVETEAVAISAESIEEESEAVIEETDIAREVPESPANISVDSLHKETRKRSLENDAKDDFSITHEKTKKRVPAKLIDSLWSPLDVPDISAVENILYISLNRTMENYDRRTNSDGLLLQNRVLTSTTHDRKLQKKYQEAKYSLTQNWIDANDPKSFISRLRVTKLPSKASLVGGGASSRNSRDPEQDPMLSYDQLRRHKKLVESYLLAEMKQLHELERTYKKLQTLYQLDRKYLNDYKRIVEADTKRMTAEITNYREQLGMDTSTQTHNTPVLLLRNKSSKKSTFNPETDQDVQDILHLFKSKLFRNGSPSQSELSQKMDKVYSMLVDEET